MDISTYQHMNIRMSTRGKRPLRNLTPSDKVRAIQRIHNGETKASVSRDIGVPESTLRGWCKNEQKLRFMCRQLEATDQLIPMSGIENPLEKRPRFDNHIQTPKYASTSRFEEFGYSRLPLNGLNFPPNGSNAILEKIALNEIMEKYILSADSVNKLPLSNKSTQISSIIEGPIPINADYNSHLSMLQNLNILSWLSPNKSEISNLNSNGNRSSDVTANKIQIGFLDETINIIKSNGSICSDTNNSDNNHNSQNISINSVASLSVKNWAKDPAEKYPANLKNENSYNTLINTASNSNTSINRGMIYSNNNSAADKSGKFSIKAQSDVLNFPLRLPSGTLQSSNDTAPDSESDNSTVLLEWCKVFNASLNFLAMAAAAAALQPNAPSANNAIKKENNILYKELTKTANLCDATNNPLSLISSDVSNDSYFDSEPEDLSIRSTTTSKFSSHTNSRSESPFRSNGSCSPLQSEH